MDQSEIDHRFQFHPTDSVNSQDAIGGVHDAAKRLAITIDVAMSDGREKSAAIARVEEACMWARAGVDRADGPNS